MLFDKIKSVNNLSKNSEQKKSPLKEAFFAERERFELSVPVYPVRRFSKPLPSATRPSLRD